MYQEYESFNINIFEGANASIGKELALWQNAVTKQESYSLSADWSYVSFFLPLFQIIDSEVFFTRMIPFLLGAVGISFIFNAITSRISLRYVGCGLNVILDVVVFAAYYADWLNGIDKVSGKSYIVDLIVYLKASLQAAKAQQTRVTGPKAFFGRLFTPFAASTITEKEMNEFIDQARSNWKIGRSHQRYTGETTIDDIRVIRQSEMISSFYFGMLSCRFPLGFDRIPVLLAMVLRYLAMIWPLTMDHQKWLMKKENRQKIQFRFRNWIHQKFVVFGEMLMTKSMPNQNTEDDLEENRQEESFRSTEFPRSGGGGQTMTITGQESTAEGNQDEQQQNQSDNQQAADQPNIAVDPDQQQNEEVQQQAETETFTQQSETVQVQPNSVSTQSNPNNIQARLAQAQADRVQRQAQANPQNQITNTDSRDAGERKQQTSKLDKERSAKKFVIVAALLIGCIVATKIQVAYPGLSSTFTTIPNTVLFFGFLLLCTDFSWAAMKEKYILQMFFFLYTIPILRSHKALSTINTILASAFLFFSLKTEGFWDWILSFLQYTFLDKFASMGFPAFAYWLLLGSHDDGEWYVYTHFLTGFLKPYKKDSDGDIELTTLQNGGSSNGGNQRPGGSRPPNGRVRTLADYQNNQDQ